MWFVSLALAGPVVPPQVSVPAIGRQEAVFTVDRFGRYAIGARSPRGTAIQVVDLMSGPGPVVGRIAEEDGRTDLFLEPGRVKVVAWSDPAGEGQAELEVEPFVAAGPPLQLVEERLVSTTLADLGERSWWIEVDEARTIAVEAAGRYLGELRLWRDGSWLVDTAPRCTVIEPVPGQPWTRCALVSALEPGWYLLSAYGSPSRPWTEARDTSLLQLRWGVPLSASAGRRTATLDETGYARFRMPNAAEVFHLALPDVAPARIRVATIGADPLVEAGAEATLTDEARRPFATVRASGTGERVVTVSGAPGQVYTLTWFRPMSTSISLSTPGQWFVGSLAAADPADVPDPGAVLYRTTREGAVIRSTAQGIVLDASARYERRFNLAERAVFLLDVTIAGPYVARVEGTPADLRIQPFLVTKPKGYEEPPWKSGEITVDLDVGLYALELSPREPGIATLAIGHDSWASRAKRAVTSPKAPVILRPALQLVVDVEPGGPLVLQTHSNGVPTGVILRQLPFDPGDPLPVTLLPGEVLELPISPAETGTLSAVGPDGKLLPISLDGAPEIAMVLAGPGAHVLRVRNPGTQPIAASIGLVPDRLVPGRPLSAPDAAALASRPALPELTSARPLGADLESGRSTTARLVLREPGLYVLESTGLLATSGAVRTRTRTSLVGASANGVGRNFQIAAWLGSGDYQLTASTLGESAGHLGLRARAVPMLEGGIVTPDVPARATVGIDEGIRYRFTVPSAGEYHLSHAGRTGVFRCRIEDDDGWPITAPERTCDLDLRLETGDYVLVGLPERVESRRITTIARRSGPIVAREGHGPHALPLGVVGSHVWTEPADGGDRVPDVWTATLPAAVDAQITLSAEMAGELTSGGNTVRLVPGEPWSGALPAGALKIEVRGARRGTGVPYTIALDTTELVAGASRFVSPPARLPVAVAVPGVYTFASQGKADVRARLVDGDGRVVAANDDRPDDWNFQLSPRLSPGRYTLVVDAVADVATPAPEDVHASPEDTGGASEGEQDEAYDAVEDEVYDEGYDEGEADGLTVTMRAPREVDGPALDGTATVSPGADALLLAVSANGADVLVARAKSAENVGIAIEQKEADGWRGLADASGREAFAVARLGDRDPVLRVRVWSEDLRGGTVTVEVEGLRARHAGSGAVSGGHAFGSAWGAVRLDGDAGQYALEADRSTTWACRAPSSGCVPATDGWLAALDEGLVLVKNGGVVRARRVALVDRVPSTVRLADEVQRVDVDGSGPLLVEVRGASSQPGVSIPDGEGAGAGRGDAVALALRGSREIRLWDAAREPGILDVSVTAHRLAPPTQSSARDGRTPVTIPARGTVTIALPGPRDAAVALDAGLVLATADGRVAWADPGALAVRVRGVDGRLVLANPGPTAALALVDLFPRGADGPLVAGSPHEAIAGEAETWLVPVPADAERELRIHGTATGTLYRADGQILRGAVMPIGPGGTLSLAVRPGPVLAWVQGPGEQGPSRVGRGGGSTRLDGNGTVVLSGDDHRIVLRSEEPSVVRLRAPCPAVAEISIPGGWDRTEVLDTGDRLDLWLPDGSGEVAIRALAGAALYGELSATRSPVRAIGDGLGPEVLLAPGDAALFALHLDADRTIGFGARAGAERVEATLMDGTGRPLASGVVGMSALVAGDYLLRLSQPGGTSPVRARPVVAGIVPPSQGPPDEVVRQYLTGGVGR